jgi:WD40 repeat protein
VPYVSLRRSWATRTSRSPVEVYTGSRSDKWKEARLLARKSKERREGPDGRVRRRCRRFWASAIDPVEDARRRSQLVPDGELIFFSTRPLLVFDTSGRSELYTIEPDGSGMQALTSYGEDGPRATQPRWTPDGKAILYTRVAQRGSPRHIWAIDRTGGKEVPVLTKETVYTHPVLQPR